MQRLNNILQRYLKAKENRNPLLVLYWGLLLVIFHPDRKQEEIGVKGHLGEIGIRHGKLFILLYLMRRDDEKALAVDVFENPEQNIDRSGAGNKEEFIKNMEIHAKDLSYLKIMQTDSTKSTIKI